MKLSFDDDARLRGLINDYPDFPEKGILFRDIQPLLANGAAFERSIELMNEWLQNILSAPPKAYVSIESRGFLFGSALAYSAGAGNIILRKKGKLPGKVEEQTYDLEYGTATIEVGAGIIREGATYVVVDDVLATGGTARAACDLVERLGGKVAGCVFAVELKDLEGRFKIIPRKVASLIKY